MLCLAYSLFLAPNWPKKFNECSLKFKFLGFSWKSQNSKINKKFEINVMELFLQGIEGIKKKSINRIWTSYDTPLFMHFFGVFDWCICVLLVLPIPFPMTDKVQSAVATMRGGPLGWEGVNFHLLFLRQELHTF